MYIISECTDVIDGKIGSALRKVDKQEALILAGDLNFVSTNLVGRLWRLSVSLKNDSHS